jgi:CDP-glucose 4,6-dehydratase
MEKMVKMNTDFWHGKRVLLTGHTGFKGSWMALWLRQLGAQVCGIALPPATDINLFELARVSDGIDSNYCNILESENLALLVRKNRPEVIFHLAAQPLVRASYVDPVHTFATNIMGTTHVLDALRGLDSVRVAVMVTTDKVYQNHEQIYPYREHDVLGGHDPYSASKAASEIVIASYRDSFLKNQGVAIASARAGNVIGGGDWSADRLIPDAIRAWQANKELDIRRPDAIRPWQHVIEPLYGYLSLAEKLWSNPSLAGPYNFGPDVSGASTVKEVIELAARAYGHGQVSYGNDCTGPHEAGLLALEVAKARVTLGVEPRWLLQETVARTIAWYKAQCAGGDARELCLEEIRQFHFGKKNVDL